MKKILFLIVLVSIGNLTQAQIDRWQQRVAYTMEIDVDANANQFQGHQLLTYTNNSPDTLRKVFFHLYYNAFQPGSMMDVRSRTLPDPGRKIGDRIFHLTPDRIGSHEIKKLKLNGEKQTFNIEGTVMKVNLTTPILPGAEVVFEMDFKSQVPEQIRRTGRDNAEGVRLSMAQWFPKIAEYDYSGWHVSEYVAREFYSPWGDYDVTINIDETYVVGATGVLQADQPIKGNLKTHRFIAENVHDFVWAADPDFTHKVVNVREGLDFHFYYQEDTLVHQWNQLETYVKRMLPFIEERCGEYPYPVYSIIQGGDGGMEYPMATLVTAHRSMESFIGVVVHELMHSWYQMILGSNESYYYWMDEGFNVYYDDLTMDHLFNTDKALKYSYKAYKKIVEMGLEEPLTTHADHFESNAAYGMAAYRKGALTLVHLSSIMGKDLFDKAMLRYYNDWKFKHPNAVDFELIMEKESGLELSWYFDYWTKTTKVIDYGVKSVMASENGSVVRLERVGEIPMPLDVEITYKDGSTENLHIPIRMTRGHRPLLEGETLMTNWAWVNPIYAFELERSKDEIQSIVIDPVKVLSDINYQNNYYSNAESTIEIKGEKIQNMN